eukprot:COSAG01_NODE_59750_length_298_cov_1.040201_1_plen_71_part_01
MQEGNQGIASRDTAALPLHGVWQAAVTNEERKEQQLATATAVVRGKHSRTIGSPDFAQAGEAAAAGPEYAI